MVRVRALDVSIDLAALIKGQIVVPALIVDQPVVHLAKSEQGKANWQLKGNAAAEKSAKATPESARSQAPGELPAILKLVVRDGRVTYHDPVAKQAMLLTIVNFSGSTRGPDGNVILDGQGRLQGQPWRLDFNAGALEKLLAANARYPLDLEFNMGDTRARINGALEDATQLGSGDLIFSLRGPGLEMLSAFLGPSAPRLPPYAVQGRVKRAGQTWQVQDLQAKVGESDLRGGLAVETGGKRPMIKADLSSRQLDYADFVGLTSPSKQSQEKPKPLDISALKTVDAIIDVRGDEILTPTLALHDVRAAVRLQNGRLRVHPLSMEAGGGRVRAEALVDSSVEPFKASLRAEVQPVNLRKLGRNVDAAQGLTGIVDGQLEVSVTGAKRAQVAKAAEANPLAVIDSLVVEDSRISYDAPGTDTRLEASADTVIAAGHRQLAIKGDGHYRGEPFNLIVRGDSLMELANTTTDKPYTVSANASAANTEIALEGTFRQPLAFKDVDLSLSVKGAGTNRLAAALGKPLPNLPAYSLRGRLRRQDANWRIKDFDGRVGDSDVSGDIVIDTNGKRPFIKAALVSRRLDYADFATVLGAEPDRKQAPSQAKEQKPAQLAAGRPAEPPLDLAPLQRFNASISFEGREIIAPNLPLKDIAVDIALREGRLNVKPFTVGVGGGTVEGALRVSTSTPIRGHLTTEIEQMDIQRVVEPFDLESKFGVLDGHANIAIAGATEQQIAAAAEQTALTFIHSLVITDTRFAYVDAHSDIDLELFIRTTETSNGAEPIIIDGRGRYHGEAFRLNVGAGSLLRLLEEIRPYPIEARAEVAKTKAKLKGSVTRPLNLKGMDLALQFEGPNTNRLAKFLGLSLPDLPPYKIQGQVAREGDVWRLSAFKGRVGDSDLAGDIEVRTLRDPRPLIAANIVSRRLDLDDLGGLIGAAPDTGHGETESAQQEVEAKTETKTKTVLPRDPVDLSGLRKVDARVSFNGKRIETGLPIDDLRIEAKLDAGRLTLKPLDFGVGGGTIKSRLQLDGSARPVQADLQTEVRRVNLRELLRGSGFAQKSVGNIGGRAKLKATGNSIADLMATLDGGLSLIMTGGELNSLLIELTDLDVQEAVVDLLGDEEAVPIRCAFTDLAARSGQIDIKSLVIDTTDTRFSGDGNIDLDQERIKFVMAPHPKDFSLFTLRTPLHVAGRFSDLAFYPEYSELAERTAAAVVLGLVATPFATLIPLIETGTGKNAACQSLLGASNVEQRTVPAQPSRERGSAPEKVFLRRGH
jgi:uncharacterized protein involved in outer membrane biogenesis